MKPITLALTGINSAAVRWATAVTSLLQLGPYTAAHILGVSEGMNIDRLKENINLSRNLGKFPGRTQCKINFLFYNRQILCIFM